jgi:hypothetical protein
MNVDKSSKHNQILVIKGQKRKNFNDQYGRRAQQRNMSTIKCHYCESLVTYKQNVQNLWTICEL